MFLKLREKLAEALRRAGFRAVTPYKVGLGWVDIAVPRTRMGIDIFDGCIESCYERLSSHPFKDVRILDEESIAEFCREFNISLEQGEEELDSPSIYIKAFEDSLAYLYVAGEVYEKDIEYKPLNLTLTDLKRLGYAISNSTPKLKPEPFVSLSHNGYIAARKVVCRRVEAFEKDLRRISNEKSYIIALGLSEGLSLAERDSPEDFSLKTLLSYMKKKSIEEIRLKNLVHPKLALCRFLINTVLNGEAVKLVKKLCEFGLAFKVKIHSPYGYFIGEEYRVAREAVEAIMKFSYAEIPKETLDEFLSLTLPLTQQDLQPIMSRSQTFLKNAEKSGVCKIEGSKIRIGEKFLDYARVRLAMLSERVIAGLS